MTVTTSLSRSLRAVVAAGLAIICGVLVAGCGPSTARRTAPAGPTAARADTPVQPPGRGSNTPRLAIVTTNRANQPPVALTPQLRMILTAAVNAHELVSVSTADGVPRTVQTVQIATSGNNAAINRTQNAQNLATVVNLLQSPAKQVEANPLQAIGVAGRWLEDGGGPKQLIVIDSGLQTIAPLRFEDGLLNPRTSASRVESVVESQDSEPDLDGVAVAWFGLGQTSAPQAPLTLAAFNTEEQIWTAVLAGARVSSTQFSGDQLPASNPIAGLPAVSPVPVPALGSGSTSPSAATSEPPPLTQPISWQDATFSGDKAVLVNPSSTEQALAKLAKALISGRYAHIELVGTTANVGPFAGQQILSKQRAQVIARLLIRLGVAAKDITSVQGLGSHFPGHLPEFNPDGTLNEQLASEDRLVIVTALS